MNFQKQMFGKVESVMDLSEPPGAVEVRGIAAKEEVDAAGEKLSYQDSKPAFRKWSDDTKKRSRGLSVGNLRNMHGKVSAGKVIELTEDDANKCFRVVAQVIDTNSANLARTGCLTGFSVGGDYDKTWPDPVEKFKGKPVRVFTPILVELSIVDAPCSPSATFDYVKLDGSRSLVKFQLPPADAFLQSLDEHMAQVREQALELGKLISPRASEGTFSTGKDEEGKLITADHHRGAAVSARQSGDEPKAKSLEAQAASLDAWDRNTADAHTKAAQAHTAAYEATLASGNEPAAIGHQASAAGHELKAKELSEATSKCLTDALLEKYSEDQPRDDNGKFSSGGGGNAPTEPVDSKFADRHPFVSAFLDTHNTGEKAGDYLRTVPDDKLRTAARLVANTQDIGSHTVRTYIEREAQRRGIALKAATPDSLAKEARHEADPVTAAIAEYLKLENVSVTDEEIQRSSPASPL
jgi:hypothetical protein